jgi:hypothetical protein
MDSGARTRRSLPGSAGDNGAGKGEWEASLDGRGREEGREVGPKNCPPLQARSMISAQKSNICDSSFTPYLITHQSEPAHIEANNKINH